MVNKYSKFQMDTFDSFWEMDSDKKLNRPRSIDFYSSYVCAISFWNCSESVFFFVSFLARLFEEKKSSYCRHSGVSVSVSVWVG
jgi:hypothetical protein